MRQTHRTTLAALGITLALSSCNGSGATGDSADAGGGKAAYEAAIAELKQPVAIISAYVPYLAPPDTTDKYSPKRRPDAEKSSACAANEIRHAANGARQKLPSSAGPAIKDLETALTAVAAACADAGDPEAFAKCEGSVKSLDGALDKSNAAASAAGAAGKFPRVATESITEEAKKGIATFMKVRGPGPAEKAYQAKRGDAAVSAGDLIAACQGSAEEVDALAKAYEKAEEPIRLIAVTHKMSMDSQCGGLNALENLRKELVDCKKKPKTPECKITCGKARAKVDDGVPAATFTPLEKEVADVCKE